MQIFALSCDIIAKNTPDGSISLFPLLLTLYTGFILTNKGKGIYWKIMSTNNCLFFTCTTTCILKIRLA